MPNNNKYAQTYPERVKLIKGWLAENGGALAALPYAELEKDIQRKLVSIGHLTVGEYTLRQLRHEARKNAGLPFDGISYPQRRLLPRETFNNIKFAETLARNSGGFLLVKDLMQRSAEAGHPIGRGSAARIIRKIERVHGDLRGRATRKRMEAGQLVGSRGPMRQQSRPPLPLQIAIRSLADSMKAESVISCRVNVTVNGVDYSIEKEQRKIETLTGILKA